MKKAVIIIITFATFMISCKAKELAGEKQTEKAVSVLVYITGVTAGSPTYEMLAAGALEFAAEHNNVVVKIYEAGFNQAEWEEQLRAMVSEGAYDLVLGSNPSLPQICADVGNSFPAQKFIVTDAQFTGNMQICTYLYSQYEQALFLGYLAGLVTTSGMPHANASKHIGFIAAQEFPLLTKQIVPGFLDGARLVDPGIDLDFRVIGNWFDANKAADLAYAMINSGVDVFSSIAGGAVQGIIKAITEREASGKRSAYLINFNTNEYNKAPGFIVGCGIMEQKKLVKEILNDYLIENIPFGTSQTVGVKEGYLDFIFDDPGYRDHIPSEVKDKFGAFMKNMKADLVEYTVPML